MDEFTWATERESWINGDAEKWTIDKRDHVVGSFDQHNSWKDYDDYLFKGINTEDKIALDFGTGPGRNIVKFYNRFKRIDGVDIGQKNLENAKIWIEYNGLKCPYLYKTNGIDLSVIPNNNYDIVFSTICLQHIGVHKIRYSLMSEFYRVLKPEGWFAAQMGYKGFNAEGNGYFENNYTSSKDVSILDEKDLEGDLVKIGFKDFSFDSRPVGPGDAHNSWIFFRTHK